MKTVKSYIKYVKNETENVKLIHAVVVSSILTGVFAGIYLYLVRGITPPAPAMLKTEQVIYQSDN
jgi:hypothetical protein